MFEGDEKIWRSSTAWLVETTGTNFSMSMMRVLPSFTFWKSSLYAGWGEISRYRTSGRTGRQEVGRYYGLGIHWAFKVVRAPNEKRRLTVVNHTDLQPYMRHQCNITGI